MFQNSLEFRVPHEIMAMNTSHIEDGFRAGQGRVCNTCNFSTCMVYCHTDLAYLCASCDATIHGSDITNQWHERVPVCSVCQYNPAVFTCKADAASLCATCDAEIHSANVLASRHERVLVQPISGLPCEPSTIYNIGKKLVADCGGAHEDMMDSFEDDLNSWLLLEPENNDERSNEDLSYDEVDHYLDLTEYDSGGEGQFKAKNNLQQSSNIVHQVSSGSDSLVPEQSVGALAQQQRIHPGTPHRVPNAGEDNSATSQSVFVPCSDASNTRALTVEDIPNYSNSKSPEGMFGTLSNTSLVVPPDFSPTNREAKVLRYREKRKARKFEKSIRYAARKAYAETRPRVKGRFASRTAVELELDQILSNADFSFSIVPSI